MSIFNYVSREEYDREHDARLRAETEAEFLRGILEHFLPPVERAGIPSHEEFSRMTPEEIMLQPATGKRELQMRERRYRAAVTREERESRQRAQDKLAPDEQRAVKESLATVS